MNFYREVLNSKNLERIINLPPELRNTDVEIIVLPVKKAAENQLKSSSTRGALKKYANPELIQYEKDAWAEAVGEKYANN